MAVVYVVVVLLKKENNSVLLLEMQPQHNKTDLTELARCAERWGHKHCFTVSFHVKGYDFQNILSL